MELIVGGAWQGQLEYAKEQHPGLSWANGADCSWEELCGAGGVYDFQEFIRERLARGEDVQELADKLYARSPELVVVSNEVGCGLVPIDAFEREWREAVGRVCTGLAAKSRRVVRVVCGIGTVIKNA